MDRTEEILLTVKTIILSEVLKQTTGTTHSTERHVTCGKRLGVTGWSGEEASFLTSNRDHIKTRPLISESRRILAVFLPYSSMKPSRHTTEIMPSKKT